MKRSEQRQVQRALERRILAGERKADIVSGAAADGQDWLTHARLVSHIPTLVNRRRWRWLNRALIALTTGTAAVWVAGLVSFETGPLLAVAVVCPFLLFSTVWGLVRYRQRAYCFCAGIGVIGLWTWLLTIGWHNPGPHRARSLPSRPCSARS